MQVSEIMSRPVIVVEEHDSLETVAQTLIENNIGGVPVVDSAGGVTGIITESDFGAKERSIPFSTFRSAKVLDQWLSGNQIERIYDSARNRTAQEIMSRSVKVLSEDDPVEKAVELLLKHEITRLPVVRGGKPVGMVARRDLLRLMVKRGNIEKQEEKRA